MQVLILFATIEGQTGKIARFLVDQVETLGHTAILRDAGDTLDETPETFDVAILAAPVHERRHPRDFEAYLEAARENLSAHRTLLISVSLSAAFPEGQDEAAEYVTEMKMRTGVEPDVELLVAGAVKTAKYDYFASQIVRHVVLRDRDYDPDAGEHEFTDWDRLADEVAAFLAG